MVRPYYCMIEELLCISSAHYTVVQVLIQCPLPRFHYTTANMAPFSSGKDPVSVKNKGQLTFKNIGVSANMDDEQGDNFNTVLSEASGIQLQGVSHNIM